MLSDEELLDAAGAYVAGDLDADECRRFEALMDQHDSLRNEVAFWRSMRPHLAEQRQIAPPEDLEFARRLRERLRFESTFRQQHRHRSWLIPALSAVAASLLTALLLNTVFRPSVDLDGQQPGTVVIVSEFNDQVHSPVRLPSQFVLNGQHDFDRMSSPWLGMAAREVRFVDEGGSTRAGYLVMTIASGGPADRAGLRTGDILVGLGHCALVDEGCLASTIDQLPPGANVPIRFWRPRNRNWHESEIEVRMATRIGSVY